MARRKKGSDRRRVAVAAVAVVAITVAIVLVLPDLYRARNYVDVVFFISTMALLAAIFAVGPLTRSAAVRRAVRRRCEQRKEV